jgi:hypothetical protein
LPDAFSSSTRLLPEHFRLIGQTTATDNPAPSLHPRYRGLSTTTSRSASAPRDGTHIAPPPGGTLPVARPGRAGCVRARLLLFRTEAADRARVVYMPDTAWPVNGHPPGLSRDYCNTPVLMSAIRVTTLPQRFARARLPDPHLTP